MRMKMPKSNSNLKLVESEEPFKSTPKNGHPFERANSYMAWPEELVVVGKDVEDDGSVLYDRERTALDLDEDLVDAIMRYGVKENVLVRKNNATDQYEVVDGRQRVVNARESNRRLIALGEKPRKVLTRLDSGSDDLMYELMIILNHRVESTPLMKAREAELFQQRSQSVKETCRVCKISESTYNNWMLLLQMDPEVHAAIDAGEISSSQALQFAKLTRGKQRKVVQKLIASDPKERRSIKRDKNTTDKAHMPSKTALLNIIHQPDGLDPSFILGLKYALGFVTADEVPGLKDIKK
jgi:ParB-like chromosome segregation protein Spo0J